MRFQLSEDQIDVDILRQGLLNQHAAGAFCSFEGWVRNQHQGKSVDALSYTAHQKLAEAQGESVLTQALAEFSIIDARCVHRIGDLSLGEIAVWVGVIAGHRDAAFAACRFIIDEIKREVPIWKHEHYREADSQWLHPKPE